MLGEGCQVLEGTMPRLPGDHLEDHLSHFLVYVPDHNAVAWHLQPIHFCKKLIQTAAVCLDLTIINGDPSFGVFLDEVVSSGL